jgi:hypothetical protein
MYALLLRGEITTDAVYPLLHEIAPKPPDNVVYPLMLPRVSMPPPFAEMMMMQPDGVAVSYASPVTRDTVPFSSQKVYPFLQDTGPSGSMSVPFLSQSVTPGDEVYPFLPNVSVDEKGYHPSTTYSLTETYPAPISISHDRSGMFPSGSRLIHPNYQTIQPFDQGIPGAVTIPWLQNQLVKFPALDVTYRLEHLGDWDIAKLFANVVDPQPYQIDIDSNGVIVVSNADKTIMEPTKRQWKYLSDLSLPIRGFAIDRYHNDDMYIGFDTKSESSVYVLSRSGAKIKQWKIVEKGQTLLFIHTIYFVSSTEMIVGAENSEKLYVTDRNGNISRTLPAAGKLYERPRQMTYDPINKWLYVAYRRGEVIVLDSRGTILSFASRPEWGPGDLNIPHGIVFDPVHRVVYVSDTGNNRILVFSPTGQKLAQWSHPGFLAPRFMLLHQGKLYVTSHPSGKVGIFEWKVTMSPIRYLPSIRPDFL